MNNSGLTTPTTKKNYYHVGQTTHQNLTQNNSSAVGNEIEASELGNMSPQRGRNKGYEYWLEAECLLNGHGIEPNKDFAITWFERSANQGEPKALNALGCIYEEGNGVKVDKPKAVDYFRQGAALGEPHAQFKLSQYYIQGHESSNNWVAPDCKKALQLLESSANNECREAMRELGQVYEKGGILSRD